MSLSFLSCLLEQKPWKFVLIDIQLTHVRHRLLIQSRVHHQTWLITLLQLVVLLLRLERLSPRIVCVICLDWVHEATLRGVVLLVNLVDVKRPSVLWKVVLLAGTESQGFLHRSLSRKSPFLAFLLHLRTLQRLTPKVHQFFRLFTLVTSTYSFFFFGFFFFIWAWLTCFLFTRY